jgi:chaperonin GroEL
MRSSRGRNLAREYVEGMYWKGGAFSREMFTDENLLRADLEDAAILITDLEIQEPEELVPVLAMALAAEVKSLLIVARELSDKAISLLLANSKPDKLQIVAVKTPGDTPAERGPALLDMAMLTGGTPYLVSAGQTSVKRARFQDLGRARGAWVERDHVGIVGGKGDPRALRRHIADMRAAYKVAEDMEERQVLQERIGKMLSGSAILWIGGVTESHISTRREMAERTAAALRGASIEGVLPGGGAALLACQPALQRVLDGSEDPDERAACRTILHALEQPLRVIVDNAGYDASTVMAQIRRTGVGYGFDVNSGRVVDMTEAGVIDVAAALKAAVSSAIAGASSALTTDVVVHHLRPSVTSPHFASYAERMRARGQKPRVI